MLIRKQLILIVCNVGWDTLEIYPVVDGVHEWMEIVTKHCNVVITDYVLIDQQTQSMTASKYEAMIEVLYFVDN